MGEKPMGLAGGETAEQETGGASALAIKEQGIRRSGDVAPGGDDNPMAGAGSINTTRSNIKNSASSAQGGGASPGVSGEDGGEGTANPGDPPAVAGEPIPGIDVR